MRGGAVATVLGNALAFCADSIRQGAGTVGNYSEGL